MSEIQNAITVLAEKIKGEIKAVDALQYTQAALNLAQTASVLADTERQKSK